MIKIKDLGKVPYSGGGIRSQGIYECQGCKKRFKRLTADMNRLDEAKECRDCYDKKRSDIALKSEGKICTKCSTFKPLHDYYFKGKNKSYHESRCKNCMIEYTKKHQESVPIETKKKWRRTSHAKSYGLTLDEFNNYFKGAECGICATSGDDDKNRLVLGHCHTSGKIRGVLCDRCNVSLGGFKDNIENLKGAIRWLEQNN